MIKSTTNDFSRIRAWPRDPGHAGIAHGWHGHAWVWLWLVRTGLVADRRATRDAIVERLARGRPRRLSSHLVGASAPPVIAALAASIDRRHVALADRILDTWTAPRRSAAVDVDVLTGTAGALLAASEVETLLPGRIDPSFSARLHRRCERELANLVGRTATQPVNLGFGHGLVGYLFSLEASHRAFRLPVRAALRRAVLAIVERHAIRTPDRGSVWPARSLDEAVTMHGWCSGGPGMALGLAACHALTARRDYLAPALRALTAAGSLVARTPSTCCGVLGQIQVLIEAARLLRDDRWLDRARRLERQLSPSRPHDPSLARGLWKGTPGYDFVAWRLAHADRLPFPGLGPLSVTRPRGLA